MPHSTSQLFQRQVLTETKGTISFIQNLPKYKTERPYRWAGALDASEEHKRTNVLLESYSNIPFADIRPLIGHDDQPSLRRDGFQILQLSPGVQDPVLGGDTNVLNDYLCALAIEIETFLSAELVYCVNFVFRQCTSSTLTTPDKTFFKPASSVKPEVPAFPAHADFTRTYGRTVIQESLTEEEATKYLDNDAYTVCLVNAWKPLYRPVRNTPLAVCDPASISPDDVLEVDIASPTRVSGATYLKHNPRHRWYWCSDQRPEEVTLFKSWDSDEKSQVPYVPHCAIRFELEKNINDAVNPELGGDEVLRDSIEARMVIVLRQS